MALLIEDKGATLSSNGRRRGGDGGDKFQIPRADLERSIVSNDGRTMDREVARARAHVNSGASLRCARGTPLTGNRTE